MSTPGDQQPGFNTMQCPECKYDETSGRCVECGSYKPVANQRIEVVCPFCPPVNEEQIAGGAFHSGDQFQENVPFTPQIMARFFFEVGAFDYVVVQCPHCKNTQAVFNVGAAGYAVGMPPDKLANPELDKLKARYEKYEAFVIYNPKLRREFQVFCEQGIFNPKFKHLGVVEKRIRSGTFQLDGNYLGSGDARSPRVAAADFLRERMETAKEPPPPVQDRTWKGLAKRLAAEFKNFRKKRLAKDREPV